DQRNVDDQPRVRRARMRRDACPRLEPGEEHGRRMPGNLGQRRPSKGCDSAWAPFKVLLPGLAVLVQEERGPAPRVVEVLPLVERRSRRMTHIRGEVIALGLEQLQQLPANVVGRRLDLRYPGKFPTIKEGDRGQARKVGLRGLRVIDALMPQKCGETIIDAILCATGMTLAYGGQPGVQPLFQLSIMG